MKPTITPSNFQKKLLAWFHQNGRKDLPWQKRITPYRVWLSEIMLQQTQVATVIDYFNRFTKTFPTLKSLSTANEDEVLALWTGLGYYARARNLLKCAKTITTDYKGRFPNTLETLTSLPGIGRSTAGAILAIAFNQPATILDGNVKRVLTRLYGIKQWSDKPKTQTELWDIASSLTPKTNTADYTQAIMDLGAMVCMRSKPLCHQCPFQKTCYAKLHNITDQIPAKKPKTEKPTKETTLLIFQNQHNEIYLEKRPSPGIWGGLWSFPELAGDSLLANFCQSKWQFSVKEHTEWPRFRHTFTHFHLFITPIFIKTSLRKTKASATTHAIWYNHIADQPQVGLPAPVKKLLEKLKETT